MRRLMLEPGRISRGNGRAGRANGGHTSTVRTAAISSHVTLTFSRSDALGFNQISTEAETAPPLALSLTRDRFGC